ncbi:undecaprenyl-diphosphate phosphatase [Marinicella gelatinilytica]|uniref:undecaprenyl-diphosphate phosphatase n=1 Tax=Marinicella gelatinilytica TaxID=2996017 RepID=UPI002260D0E7|nr:undecaprenyl-diphosphate phosphatase [Marinicella gelatinilytica]MCX7545325.1 undecaprenyl-diphosphate phosphatase [Marinicella gelatinilytica]
MIDFWHALVLALIQGLTEFLPVSSSAHLILVGLLSDWQDQGLVIDVAAHLGSLLAVLIYFRRDIVALLSGREKKLFIQIVIASLPIVVAGLLLAGVYSDYGRSIPVIAAASIFFGVLLWYSQRWAGDKNINNKSALLVGIAQCLALIPGASRSGVTITAGMALGLSKSAAARFSFLLAIPTLLMATAYAGLKWYKEPTLIDVNAVVLVIALSFVFAWLVIALFMKFIERIDFIWFMLYRILLALILLFIIL